MKKLLSSIALAVTCLVAVAQEAPAVQEETSAPVVSNNKYPNNWFVGVGGGANILFDGERYTSRDFSHVGAGIALDVYAGKWLDRVVGFRLAYQGLNASSKKTVFGETPMMYAHADVLLRPRSWIVPYAHAGYFRMVKSAFGGGAGLMFPIHVGRISIVPDFRATLTDGAAVKVDDVKAFGLNFSATVGLAIRFGGKSKVVTRYVDRNVYVPVEKVDTVVVKQIDTVVVREVIRGKADEFNRIMSGLVLFDINSSVLRPEAIPVLNDAALFLRENPDVKVIVEGHTDNTGSDRINEPLSERRARAVAEYLIRRGVEADRVKAVGFGSTRPKTTNDTALGRQLNRRMEFVFDIQ